MQVLQQLDLQLHDKHPSFNQIPAGCSGVPPASVGSALISSASVMVSQGVLHV